MHLPIKVHSSDDAAIPAPTLCSATRTRRDDDRTHDSAGDAIDDDDDDDDERVRLSPSMRERGRHNNAATPRANAVCVNKRRACKVPGVSLTALRRSHRQCCRWTMLVLALVLCATSAMARPNNSAPAGPAAPNKLLAALSASSSGGETWSVRADDKTASTPAMVSPTAGDEQAKPSPSPTDTSTATGEADAVSHNIGTDHKYPIIQVEFDRVQTPLVIGIWILSASIAKIGFHKSPKLNRIFPESCLLIVIGVIIGFILLFGTRIDVSPLTPNTFFLYMLPPIILDAGYFMPNRMFFDNLGTILLMAVVGTIFNIATIGSSLWLCGQSGLFGFNTPVLDIFLFASLISAVDPVAVLAVFEEIHVNEILYIVVFGESLLNDAVTVVLYHMCEVYSQIGIENINVTHLVSGGANFLVVALGGTIIGVIWGFLTGLVTRYTDNVRVIEPIFIFVMAYLAYLNAELFHMSGILAITFCGITMKNYVEANISQKSHTTIKYALKMVSSSSETIIFMFLGVATVNNRHDWNTWFIVLTIVFCSVFRAAGVAILTAMANKFRLHKLSNVDQFVMSYGGLRGAVAFALVLLINKDHVPLKPMFVTTTIAVIYFTVFLQGITIKPLVKFLNVERANKRKPTMNERIHERFIDHLMAGVEDIVGKTGNYNVRDKFKRFDNKFIRPLLIRDLQVRGAEPKILETYSKLTMKDAMDYMRRNPSTLGQMTGTESMSALFRNYTGIVGMGGAGSPSFSNFENCSRNLDMQELDYNPSKKDLTDAKIHHLLAEELKPYKRHRRLSYSRHAVDDRDLTTQQVNYKTHMNFRRMNDRKHHKRSKRASSKENTNKQHVSFPEFQALNGSIKQLSNDYINEVLHEHPDNIAAVDLKDVASASSTGVMSTAATPNNQPEDWEEGLTFTAKPTFGVKSEPIYASDEKQFVMRPARDSEGDSTRVTTPTAIEASLPWKRLDEDEADGGAIKQNEFPAWASNKEYIAYNSPSATFLGGLSKPRPVKSVIGLFRRESFGSQSRNGVTSSDHSTGSVGEAGSDPTLASQLNVEMMPVPAVAARTPLAGRATIAAAATLAAAGLIDRRPVVIPIVETGEFNEETSEDDDDDDDDDEDDGDECQGACGGVGHSVRIAIERPANGANGGDNNRDPLGALTRSRERSAQSVAATASPAIGAMIVSHHMSPYPVSHRRNRRSSMLELNGSSNVDESHSKSMADGEQRKRSGPLLPVTLTPRSELRRPNQRQQQTTSPLLSDSTDSETEEFHDGTDEPDRLPEPVRNGRRRQTAADVAATTITHAMVERHERDSDDPEEAGSNQGVGSSNA